MLYIEILESYLLNTLTKDGARFFGTKKSRDPQSNHEILRSGLHKPGKGLGMRIAEIVFAGIDERFQVDLRVAAPRVSCSSDLIAVQQPFCHPSFNGIFPRHE